MKTQLQRLKDGIELVEQKKVHKVGEIIVYEVEGSAIDKNTGRKVKWTVTYNKSTGVWDCDCPDKEHNVPTKDCKHIFGAKVEEEVL